jgi:hypothetical protein
MRAAKAKPAPGLLPRFLLTPRTALFIAGTFCIVMSSIAFSLHSIGGYAVETDFYWAYAPHAKQILAGHLIVDQFKGPGYELVLAAVGAAVRDFFRAGMIISIASAVVALYLTYKLVARLFSNESAFLVCLVAATNHIFLISSYTASTDMFFNMLAVIVLYLLLRSDELRLPEMAAAGAIAGFAYITRYNAVAFFFAAIVGLLVLNYKTVAWRKRLIAAGLFMGASLLFIAPWGLYCRAQTGSFFYNNNHLNIAYEMFGKGKMEWDEYWHSFAPKFRSYLDVLAYDPGAFCRQITTNAVEHFTSDLSLLVPLPLGIFAVAGIIALFAQRLNRQQVMFFLFSAAFYVVLLPVFYGERFSLFLVPTIALLAISFFQWKKIPTIGFERFGLKHLLLVTVLVVSAATSYQRVAQDIDSGPREILKVRDLFFRNSGNAKPGQRIVARKPHIAYYLNMEFIPFPYVDTLDDLLRECRKAGATHLYYSTVEAGMRPQFRYLLDPHLAPPELHPIVLAVFPPLVLYELKSE